MITDTPATIAQVTLPATLDLKAAGALALQLRGLRGNDLAIDGSTVQRLGAPCLQVLLAARRSWAEDGKQWLIDPVSDPLAASLSLLGARDLLGQTEKGA